MKLSGCSSARYLAVAALVVATACGGKASAPPASKVAVDGAAQQSSDSAAAMAAVRDTATVHRMSPAADSVAPFLVFVPREESLFVAAVRNKQLLLDVGRIDLEVRKDSAKRRAFHEAARILSPVPAGTVFRLHWAQGRADVVADSFDVYNGRIVMRVFGSPALDTAVRGNGALVALAARADSALAPVATACELRAAPDNAVLAAEAMFTPAERSERAAARKSADSVFDARVKTVRDSLEVALRAERPPYERLQRRIKASSSQVRGCFGVARRALVVSLRAGDAEWVRERLVLVAPDGAVTPLRVSDLRFRAHDLLVSFDVDGDGVDDLATRATTERAGGTTVLRVDLAKKRAERVAGGFAWERM